MDTRERIQLARDLCRKVVAAYPGELLVGGLFGSAARGDDTEWSDLDLLFVTVPGSRMRGRHLVVRSIAVSYQVIDEERLTTLLNEPNLEWPYYMGVLSTLKLLHGDPLRVATWLEQGKAVPRERLHLALSHHLPELVFESYGRVRSCGKRRDGFTILHAVSEVLYEMKTALCLLNGRWVTHDYYRGFEEVFLFPHLPRDYRELVTTLWQAREIDQIVTLTGTLVAGYWYLLTSMGLNVVNYQSVESIEF